MYSVADISEVYIDDIHPGRYIFFPEIQTYTQVKHQKRKCFIFICFWQCENVLLSHDFDITLYHNASSWGITNPLIYSPNWGPTSECKHDFNEYAIAHGWSLYWAKIPPPFEICVDEVEVVGTNSSPITPVTAEYDCD